MIDRIVETFTKPKMEITAIDELIQGATIIFLLVLAIIIYLVVEEFIKK